MVGDQRQRLVERLVRIALRQQAHQRAEIADAGERQAAGMRRRPERQRFDGVGAEMLVEAARQPGRACCRLQRALHARRTAAAHQAEMAPMPTRHRLDDRRRLAVPPDADDDALIAPFHRAARTQLGIDGAAARFWKGCSAIDQRYAGHRREQRGDARPARPRVEQAARSSRRRSSRRSRRRDRAPRPARARRLARGRPSSMRSNGRRRTPR